MKITVFYRSLEKNNAIVSSTRDELKYRKERGELTCLEMDFINLDKRNYKKYLALQDEENELPEIIYIWYDEEVVGDYIKETYPQIRVVHFDTKCIKHNVEQNYHYGYRSRSYHLIDDIIAQFKASLVKKEYIIANAKTQTIETVYDDELSIGEKLHSLGKDAKIVANAKDGFAFLNKKNEEKVAALKKEIEHYSELVKKSKQALKEVEKAIAKLEKECAKIEKN